MESTAESRELYHKCLKDLLESKSSKPVSCNRPEHAVEILKLFLREANKFVRIYTGDYPMIVRQQEHIHAAIHRGIWVDIIINPDTSEVLSKEERALFPRRCEFLQENPVGTFKGENPSYYIMDHTAYRYDPNGLGEKSHACLYEPKTSGKLVELFHQSASRSRSQTPAS